MQSYSNQNDNNLKPNDLVWGKIVGYPWWPGLLTKTDSNQDCNFYRVDFFGNPSSHSLLPVHKIIKYQSFDRNRNVGRPSPSLKKAITEASILYSTLEESKNLVGSFKVLEGTNIENQYTIASLMKSSQELQKFGSQNSNKQNSLQQNVDQEKQLQIPKMIKKRGRPKNRDLQKINRLQERRIRQFNKQIIKNRKIELKYLLNKYKLNTIPKPRKEPQRINTDPLVINKIHSMFRKYQYEEQQSRKFAILLKSRMSKISDFSKLRNLLKTKHIEERDLQLWNQQKEIKAISQLQN